jgi:addiction module RelE/StbE family toxin
MVSALIIAESFDKDFKKIRDKSLRQKVRKAINKILRNPAVGKPLKYAFKGERTVHVKPYRIIYSLFEDKLVLLRFEHRKSVYKK